MKGAAEPAHASDRGLHAVLLDYFASPGSHQLGLREPALLFNSIREILQIAAGRGTEDEGLAGRPSRLREAAVFFVRVGLLSPGADHYAVFGLPRRSEPVELKDRYRLLMRLIHPDFAAAGGSQWPADAAVRVNRAYEVLSSAVLRSEYDDQLAASAVPRPAGPLVETRRPAAQAVAQDRSRVRISRRVAWTFAGGVGILGAVILAPRTEPESLVQKAPAAPGSAAVRTEDSERVSPAALVASDRISPANLAAVTPAPAPAPAAAPPPATPPSAVGTPPPVATSRPLPQAVVPAAPAAAVAATTPAEPVPAPPPVPSPAITRPPSPVAPIQAAGPVRRPVPVVVALPAADAQAARRPPPAVASLPLPPPLIPAPPARTAAFPSELAAALPVPTAPAPTPAAPALQPPPPPAQRAEAAAPALPAPGATVVVAASTPPPPPVKLAPVAAAIPSPTLADAQPLLTQLLQMLETGSGEQVLRLLDAEARSAPPAQALSQQYEQLVRGGRPVRVSQVEFRSEPRDGVLHVTGRIRMHAGEPTIGAPGERILLRAEFVSRGGKVMLKGLSGAAD